MRGRCECPVQGLALSWLLKADILPAAARTGPALPTIFPSRTQRSVHWWAGAALAGVLLAAPTHMTADQLLAALKLSPPRVSKATVYNTLKLFVDHGLARQIHLDPDRCVYDSTMTPHHHFQNVETGEMLDILPEALELAKLPPLPAGTEIDSIDVVIRVRSRSD